MSGRVNMMSERVDYLKVVNSIDPSSEELQRRLPSTLRHLTVMEAGEVESCEGGFVMGIVVTKFAAVKASQTLVKKTVLKEVLPDYTVGKEFNFYSHGEYSRQLDLILQLDDILAVVEPQMELSHGWRLPPSLNKYQAFIGYNKLHVEEKRSGKPRVWLMHGSKPSTSNVKAASSVRVQKKHGCRSSRSDTDMQPDDTYTAPEQISLAANVSQDASSVSHVAALDDTQIRQNISVKPSNVEDSSNAIKELPLQAPQVAIQKKLTLHQDINTTRSLAPIATAPSALMPAKSAVKPRPLYKYTQIKDLKEAGCFHLFAVVVKIQKPPSQTRGPNFHSIIVIKDPSCNMAGAPADLLVHLYSSRLDRYPEVSSGDIVRLHRVRMETFNGKLDGRIFDVSHMVVFSGNQESKIEPRTAAKDYSFTEFDELKVQELREWAHKEWLKTSEKRPLASGQLFPHEEMERTLNEIKGEMKFSLYCEVLVIKYVQSVDCALLRVRDGTLVQSLTREIDSQCISQDLLQQNTPSYGSQKYYIDIVVIDQASKAVGQLKAGQFILIKNLQASLVSLESTDAASLELSESLQSLLDFCLQGPEADFVILPENHHEVRNIKRRLAQLHENGYTEAEEREDSVDEMLKELQASHYNLQPFRKEQKTTNDYGDEQRIKAMDIRECYQQKTEAFDVHKQDQSKERNRGASVSHTMDKKSGHDIDLSVEGGIQNGQEEGNKLNTMKIVQKEDLGKTQSAKRQSKRRQDKERISPDKKSSTTLVNEEHTGENINLRSGRKRLFENEIVVTDDTLAKTRKVLKKCSNKSAQLPSGEDSWDQAMRQVPSDIRKPVDGVLPVESKGFEVSSLSSVSAKHMREESVKPYQERPHKTVMECVDEENVRLEGLNEDFLTFNSHENYHHSHQDKFPSVKLNELDQGNAVELDCFQVSDLSVASSPKQTVNKNCFISSAAHVTRTVDVTGTASASKATPLVTRASPAFTSSQVRKNQTSIKEASSTDIPPVICNDTYTLSPILLEGEKEEDMNNLGLTVEGQLMGNADILSINPAYSANAEVLDIYHSDSETSSSGKRGACNLQPYHSKETKLQDCRNSADKSSIDNRSGGSWRLDNCNESSLKESFKGFMGNENREEFQLKTDILHISSKEYKLRGSSGNMHVDKPTGTHSEVGFSDLGKHRRQPQTEDAVTDRCQQTDCGERISDVEKHKQEETPGSSSTHFSGGSRQSTDLASESSYIHTGMGIIDKSASYISVTDHPEKVPVSIEQIKSHQKPARFRLQAKVISVEPSVQAVSEDATILLVGLCARCHWLFDFHQFGEKWDKDEKEKHSYQCPRCCNGEGLIEPMFLFHLHVHDKAGDCIMMYVCGSHAETFLGCSPEDYIDNKDKQVQVKRSLTSLSSGKFLDLTLLANDFGDGPEYQLFDTKLVSRTSA